MERKTFNALALAFTAIIAVSWTIPVQARADETPCGPEGCGGGAPASCEVYLLGSHPD